MDTFSLSYKISNTQHSCITPVHARLLLMHVVSLLHKQDETSTFRTGESCVQTYQKDTYFITSHLNFSNASRLQIYKAFAQAELEMSHDFSLSRLYVSDPSSMTSLT